MPDLKKDPDGPWFFDGASNALDNGIGVVLISLEGCHTPFTARLYFNCTNNMDVILILIQIQLP